MFRSDYFNFHNIKFKINFSPIILMFLLLTFVFSVIYRGLLNFKEERVMITNTT